MSLYNPFIHRFSIYTLLKIRELFQIILLYPFFLYTKKKVPPELFIVKLNIKYYKIIVYKTKQIKFYFYTLIIFYYFQEMYSISKNDNNQIYGQKWWDDTRGTLVLVTV